MLSTLRGRLILSYVGVVLPALVLATAVYLYLATGYKTQDAYTRLQSSLYLVVPQFEDAVLQQIKARVMAALVQVRTDLPRVETPALFDPQDRTRIAGTRDRVRTDLLQIDDALLVPRMGAAQKTRIRASIAAIRAELPAIESTLPRVPNPQDRAALEAGLQRVRDDLAGIDTELDSSAVVQEPDITKAAEHIRGELTNTSFRLLIVRPDPAGAYGGRVILDSQTDAGKMTGGFLSLPAALFTTTLTTPVPGRLDTGDALQRPFIFEAAPPRLLVDTLPVPQGNRVFLLLAQKRPDFADVVADFESRFLQFGVIALLVALALGVVLARSLTRPISALAAATHEIAQGNFSHQVPVRGTAEMRALAADFNRMAAEVDRTQQAQRDFLANVSHDLKTPLTSIQGYAQAMIDGALRDRAAFIDAAEVIESESQRMTRLVGDLVDLLRLQSGEVPIQKKPIDVGGLLRQAAAGMQPQATARHVELRVESRAPLDVPADADRLRRAITNLLDNALRYTPPEGRVTLSAEEVPGAVRIRVRDTGTGIPPGDLARVFERFYQVDKSRAAHGHGSGLGLAIVREIATAHGGGVAVESRPGAGSEFMITLPV